MPRVRQSQRLSLAASAFYNVYDDRRSSRFAPAGLALRLLWGELMATYGLEAWGEFKAIARRWLGGGSAGSRV